MELDWWQEHRVDFPDGDRVRSLRAVCTPCQHFSGRGAFDRNKVGWNFLICSSILNRLRYISRWLLLASASWILDWYPLHVETNFARSLSAVIFSNRNLWISQTLWCSWVLEGQTKRVYFAGDTGFCTVPRGCEHPGGVPSIEAVPSAGDTKLASLEGSEFSTSLEQCSYFNYLEL